MTIVRMVGMDFGSNLSLSVVFIRLTVASCKLVDAINFLDVALVIHST